MSPRRGIVCVLTVLACKDAPVGGASRRSPVETEIARDLTARFGTPVTVTCTMAGAVPVACSGKLSDGAALPILIENASKTEWGWRVDGRVIETRPIVAHIQEQLTALAVAQTATCGPSLIVLKAGERISCTLSGGGAAFVDVLADGSTTLELALDAQAAAARAELVTPDRDRELVQKSLALETLEGESDGEEAVVRDAGVAQP